MEIDPAMKSMIRPDESSAATSIGACLFDAALAIFVFAADAHGNELGEEETDVPARPRTHRGGRVAGARAADG